MFGVLVLIFSLISILLSIEMAVSTVSSLVLSFLNLFFVWTVASLRGFHAVRRNRSSSRHLVSAGPMLD